MPTSNEIYEKVREILVDALGADESECTMDATLMGDLGAESIDFLDIVFRLEKTFNVKIPRGELFPDNFAASDPNLTKDGVSSRHAVLGQVRIWRRVSGARPAVLTLRLFQRTYRRSTRPEVAHQSSIHRALRSSAPSIDQVSRTFSYFLTSASVSFLRSHTLVGDRLALPDTTSVRQEAGTRDLRFSHYALRARLAPASPAVWESLRMWPTPSCFSPRRRRPISRARSCESTAG